MKFMTRFSDFWIYWENRVWLTDKESQGLLSKSWETVSTVQICPVPGSMGTRQISSKHIQERNDSGKEHCSLAEGGWGRDTVLSSRLWGVNTASHPGSWCGNSPHLWSQNKLCSWISFGGSNEETQLSLWTLNTALLTEANWLILQTSSLVKKNPTVPATRVLHSIIKSMLIHSAC